MEAGEPERDGGQGRVVTHPFLGKDWPPRPKSSPGTSWLKAGVPASRLPFPRPTTPWPPKCRRRRGSHRQGHGLCLGFIFLVSNPIQNIRLPVGSLAFPATSEWAPGPYLPPPPLSHTGRREEDSHAHTHRHILPQPPGHTLLSLQNTPSFSKSGFLLPSHDLQSGYSHPFPWAFSDSLPGTWRLLFSEDEMLK